MPRGKKPAAPPLPPKEKLGARVDAFCAEVRQVALDWFHDFQERRAILQERFDQKRAEDPLGVVRRLVSQVVEDEEAAAKLAESIIFELFDESKASVYLCSASEQAGIHKVLGMSESNMAKLVGFREEVLKERGLLPNTAPAAAMSVTNNFLSFALPPDAPAEVRSWYERRALDQARGVEYALPAQADVVEVST